MIAASRDRIIEAAGLDPVDVDRLAVALGLFGSASKLSSGVDLGAIDISPPLLAPVLAWRAEGTDRSADDLARAAHARGIDELERRLAACGGDWDRMIDALGGPAEAGSVDTASPGIRVRIGAVDGAPIDWTVNRESSDQTCANARIAGAPGTGKSQFLLHLLGDVHRASGTGFILLDYKGDLAGNEAFVRATEATVIRPDLAPLPVNPFELPGSANRRLAPRSYAEAFASMSAGIGPVQVDLLTQAMERAWERADLAGESAPTLASVHRAVTEVYAEAGRGADTVTSRLRDLADHGLFAERSARPPAEAFAARWIVDLSQLPVLREFVAVTLLEHLHQVARALPDTDVDRATACRTLRGIVAVDEAHYYLAGRCAPLLGLIRVGRSKGVPVWLSSQSLEDFRAHTELNELMPNTFVFAHGVAPDAKTLAGALRVPIVAAARRVAERTATLRQFEAFATHSSGADGPRVVKIIPFYEDTPT